MSSSQIGFVPCSVSDVMEPYTFSVVNGLAGQHCQLSHTVGVFIFFTDVQKKETKKMLSNFLVKVKLAISGPSKNERNILKAL